MKLGTENTRNVVILGALLLIAAYGIYSNVLSSPTSRTPSRPAAPVAASVGKADVPALPQTASESQEEAPKRAIAISRSRSDEFHPVLRSKKEKERKAVDPNYDPTLRLDLLAKVQNVELAGGSRNLFQFSTPPAPKVAELPPPKKVDLAPPAPPQPVQKVDPGPPQPPPHPPIPLKFYALTVSRDNKRTAYFMDGEEIIRGQEGQMLNKRYRLVNLGAKTATIEDTVDKFQQAIGLIDEAKEG